MQDWKARVVDRLCCPLPRGARVHQIFDVLIVLISFNHPNHIWQHFLIISENSFFHEVKRDGITSFHGIHVVKFFKRMYNFRVIYC